MVSRELERYELYISKSVFILLTTRDSGGRRQAATANVACLVDGVEREVLELSLRQTLVEDLPDV
ncbi:MAG: hypothetical protein CVT83_08865, partial [Alphaproteobacteria bacterium HGW-Alphaproteobacteria-5]